MTARDPSIKINEQSCDESQNAFFYQYIYLFSKYPDYISDRGLLDVCAYTKWLVKKGRCSEAAYDKQMYILKEWLRTHPDTIHIYFPIYFPVKDDGYRDINEENRKEVDECICDVIYELVINELYTGYTISDSDISTRVEEIKSIINKK